MIERKVISLIVMILLVCCKETDEWPIVAVGEPQIISCEQSTCWDKSVYVCRDSTYIDLFTRSKGWTGGDATYSLNLKNGKTLWMFGDTF